MSATNNTFSNRLDWIYAVDIKVCDYRTFEHLLGKLFEHLHGKWHTKLLVTTSTKKKNICMENKCYMLQFLQKIYTSCGSCWSTHICMLFFANVFKMDLTRLNNIHNFGWIEIESINETLSMSVLNCHEPCLLARS